MNFLATSVNLQSQLAPLPYLRPAFSSTPITDRFIKLLNAESSGWSIYLGSGLFAVRSSSMQQLAAGTGHWGSGEISILQAVGWLVFDTVKVTGHLSSTAAGGAGLVAAGAALWRTARAEELEQNREDCRNRSRSTGDCVNCVMSGEEGITMLVEGAAGGAAVVLGIAAAVSATGVGVPIGIAIAVLGGLAVAISVGLNYQSIQQDCAGNRN